MLFNQYAACTANKTFFNYLIMINYKKYLEQLYLYDALLKNKNKFYFHHGQYHNCYTIF